MGKIWGCFHNQAYISKFICQPTCEVKEKGKQLLVCDLIDTNKWPSKQRKKNWVQKCAIVTTYNFKLRSTLSPTSPLLQFVIVLVAWPV